MDKHIICNGDIIDDRWIFLDDETPLTDSPNIISLERLIAGEGLVDHTAPLGVVLRPGTKDGEDVYTLAPYSNRLDIIAIDFPVFRNGRGYSTARILRDDLAYGGEIRAVGEILFDELFFMHRCGINAFCVDTTISLAQYQKALSALPDAYQPAEDQNAGILWRRHNRT